jgi:hypothetical protein
MKQRGRAPLATRPRYLLPVTSYPPAPSSEGS